MTTLKYDAHVVARRGIIVAVRNRRHEWGLSDIFRKARRAGMPDDTFDALVYQAAEAALIAYSSQNLETNTGLRSSWNEGWGNKYSRYYAFGPKQEIIGQLKNVPAHTIHSIMCCVRNDFAGMDAVLRISVREWIVKKV